MKWKDSWLTEELLALTYQHLINEFWANAAANVNKEVTEKPKKATKASNIKIINKQDNYDASSIQPQFQQTTITVSTPGPGATQLTADTSLKDIGEAATSGHIINQQVLSKLPDQTGINANTLSLVASDVTLSGFTNDVTGANILPNPQTIPKYQQALQQSISIQQQDLNPDAHTGKVTFPKHVFSQARFVNKKQQQNLVTSEQPRVNCDICQKSLKTKKMLWAHKVAVHFGGNFPCEMCGKKCITGAELRRHMTSHSTERRFVCQYCGLAYKRWSHLYQHLRVHEEEKNFRCDVCHLNFKVQSELKDHCFAEHANGKQVQCSVCKHKLQTPLAVYHHSMKHTGTRDFICEICGSNFKRKQHLVTHMKTHLTESKAGEGSSEVYNCQACEESFGLKMELKSHCSSAHPLEGDTSVTCKTCQKKLKLPHSVYLHGLRHFGARNFECTLCNQLFKRKAHLLRHTMDRHPEQPRERKKRRVHSEDVVCELCQKSFKYRTALVKHMTTQHGIFPSQTPSSELGIVIKKGVKRPHQCNVCFKRFKSKNGLAKHKVNKHSTDAEGSITTTGPTDGGEDPSMKIEEGKPSTERIEDDDEDEEDDDTETDSEFETTTEQHDSDVLPASGIKSMEVDQQASPHENTIKTNELGELEVSSSSSVVGVESKDNTENFQVVSMESFESSASQSAGAGAVNQRENYSHQVLTVDEATGQLILMTTTGPPPPHPPNSALPPQNVKTESEVLNHDGEASSVTESSVTSQQPIISMQDTTTIEQTGGGNTTYNGQQVDASQLQTLVATSQHQQRQIVSGHQLQQVSLGQILNQEGVTIASLPIQGVGNGQNIIDFSQGNNEQIVVLLSALNSENIQQIQ